MSDTAFFFVSTPQHFLMASAYALAHKELESHLLIIDQKQTDNNPIQHMVDIWPEQPFKSHHLFSGRWSGLLGKVKGRKQVFGEIAALIDQHKPSQLFTGSDKRLEFQFAASCVKTFNQKAICSYIDEGTITYNKNHHLLNKFSEKYLSNALKKLVYGNWWEHPTSYGASSHIDRVLALFPDQVTPALMKKQPVKFESNWFGAAAMKSLTAKLTSSSQSLDDVKSYDSIFLFPHSSLSKLSPGYLPKLTRLVNQLSADPKRRVAIKLHPRNTLQDFPELSNPDLLDNKLPFELFLPFLGAQVALFGDMSSTLHSARWMLPDARLFAINPTPDKPHLFQQLYQSLGISIISLEQAKELSCSKSEKTCE